MKGKFINSFTLKMIGIVTMFIDHTGYILFPNDLWFRIVGRLAFPIFAFLIAEGFRHTRDVYKYLLRLSIFAVVIQLPFILAGLIPALDFGVSVPYNIFFTLALGLLVLIMLEKNRKLLVLLPLVIAFIYYFNPDYGFYGLATILVMYYLKDEWLVVGWIALNFFLYLFSTNGVTLFTGSIESLRYSSVQVWSIMSIFIIMLYNHKKGPKMKYFFYLFYPIHLIVLYGISMLIS